MDETIAKAIEKNDFTFKSRILDKLKISINNYDNVHLEIDSVIVKGYVHRLVVRFIEPATYFLTYGNLNASKPNYDISSFISKIPDSLIPLNLGKEQQIEKKEIQKKEPLFKNKEIKK